MKRTGFATKQRKPMPRKAKKPKAQPKSATGSMLEPEYIGMVKCLPCAACGCSGPSDAHHCKDRPPFVERGVYRYFPEYGKSADADAIPLCRPCHHMFHNDHGEYARRYGPDYQHIPTTQARLAFAEVDF